MRRALSRTLTIAVTSASLVAGAVGFAHTTTGGAIVLGLTRMAHGGCPFGYDRALSPVERERARANFSVLHRGERRATNRPALGFTLEQTTREQVLTKMSANGVRCAKGHGMSDLTCEHVPNSALTGSALPTPERTLWFTFGVRDQLLSVIAISHDRNAQVISDVFVSTQDVLKSQVGVATVSTGSADTQSLSQGLLKQASAEFAFSNYYALQRAANMGQSFVFTEEYRSLTD